MGRGYFFVANIALLAGLLLACNGELPEPVVAVPGDGGVPVIVGRRGEVSPAVAERAVDELAARSDSPDSIKALIASLGADEDEPLYAGNSVRLLIDGPSTYRAMLDAIRGAREHIHLETYIFSSDAVGEEFANALIERRQAGVPVRVLYDAVGSLDSAAEIFTRLEAAGVEVQVYNALDVANPGSVAAFPTRDHRKILVVDGLVAFTGGINVSASYSRGSGGRAKRRGPVAAGWRDTHIEVHGPAVAGLQRLFLANWQADGRAIADPHGLFPRPEGRGAELVQILHADGGEGRYSAIYHAYLRAMELATRRIWITQAYFVPDDRFVATLRAAARRGVDVRIVLPGVSDVSIVLYASRGGYGDLLAAGVKLYEAQGTVLHAKTAVIDGVWSTVGSSNLDYRSFLHNDEVNAIVLGGSFAELMERQFLADAQAAKVVRSEDWRRRPVGDKVLQTLSRYFDDWL